MSRRLAAIALLCAALPLRLHAAGGGHSVGALPPFDASDSSAAVVTEPSLLASERFWPYQTELIAPWPEGEGALPIGSSGVLIRVEPSGSARIDFGRDGIHDVPIARTDLVARANRIREGTFEKLAANFTLAIGPRVLDPSGAELRPLPFEDIAAARVFVCVFADPSSKEFRALAKRLVKFRERSGVLTLLFADRAPSDEAVAAKLRELEWPVPFLFQHLADPYARTLIDADVSRPALLLLTNEGRVLAGPGSPAEVLPHIETELAEALPGA